jgi:hypothetical protein
MYGVIHSDGSGDNNPPLESLSGLYDELLTADVEHGDVTVVHDDLGWYLSAHRDGRVILRRLKDQTDARHMLAIEKERVLDLWHRLIRGDLDNLLKEPWKPGYG